MEGELEGLWSLFRVHYYRLALDLVPGAFVFAIFCGREVVEDLEPFFTFVDLCPLLRFACRLFPLCLADLPA